MDGYQLTVVVVAVVVLITILAYLSIKMNGATSQAPYPPNASACPDYWTHHGGGFCPGGNKNLGKFSSGYSFIPISAMVSGLTTACSMKKWSETNSVVWDGYSNFNQCST